MKFLVDNALSTFHQRPEDHSGDMSEGTLRAILKESGISPDEFLRKS